MDVGILCANATDKENAQLLAAFKEIGRNPCLLEPVDLAINAGMNPPFTHWREPIETIDTFVVRGVGLTTLNKSFFRLDILHAMEHVGKRLVNGARATEQALDKCMTSVILSAAGIPAPRTIVTEHVKHAIHAFDALGGDVLVKPVYGSQGAGIFRLRDRGYAERMFLEMTQAGMVYYIQEFHSTGNPGSIDVPAGVAWDARLLVVNEEVIAAMTRRATGTGTWKANIHAGAQPLAHDPSSEEVNLAVAASGALDLEVAGVDLLYSARDNAWIVLEVNCCPGWTGLSRVTRANIPLAIARHVNGMLTR